MKQKISANVREILKKNNQGIKLDIGCGGFKQPGYVGIDILDFPGVDIKHDIEKFPWPLPDECVSMAFASHLVEHINPGRSDPRLAGLVDLLLKNKIVNKSDIEEYVGDYNPGSIFIAFMNEVWRITKTGGIFMMVLPYAGSYGYWQDPTHVNPCNETTFAYFDPGHISGFWKIYQPKPWRITNGTFQVNGAMEIALVKRKVDKEGHIYN